MWRGIRISSYIVVAASILATGVLFAEAPSDTYIKPRATPTTITVGWVGDMVPSSDPAYNKQVFASVTPELQVPDLMMGNLEGTFALPDRADKCMYIMSQCYAFRGDSNFATALQHAGFDFISLINNHSYDFGEEGLRDTEEALTRVGIPFISPTRQSTSVIIKGKKIGILGLSSTGPTKTITDYDFIEREVKRLTQEHDFVIVIFHGGSEGSNKTQVPGVTEYLGSENRGDVQKVAYTAIDAGADMVLGAGPHVLRKIELYKESPIAYSLGNFVGGKQLITSGVLGVSGVFMSTLERDIPTTYDFTSVLLSRDGIPSIDFTELGKQLITSLSIK